VKEERTDRISRRGGLDPLLGARAGPRWPRARARRRPQCGHCPGRLYRCLRVLSGHPGRTILFPPQGHTPPPRHPARAHGFPAREVRRTMRRTRCRGRRRRRGTACACGGASGGRCDGLRRACNQSRRRLVRSVRLWSGAGRRCAGTRARALVGPCRARSLSCRTKARCRRRGCRTCVSCVHVVIERIRFIFLFERSGGRARKTRLTAERAGWCAVAHRWTSCSPQCKGWTMPRLQKSAQVDRMVRYFLPVNHTAEQIPS